MDGWMDIRYRCETNSKDRQIDRQMDIDIKQIKQTYRQTDAWIDEQINGQIQLSDK